MNTKEESFDTDFDRCGSSIQTNRPLFIPWGTQMGSTPGFNNTFRDANRSPTRLRCTEDRDDTSREKDRRRHGRPLHLPSHAIRR